VHNYVAPQIDSRVRSHRSMFVTGSVPATRAISQLIVSAGLDGHVNDVTAIASRTNTVRCLHRMIRKRCLT
jgi:hypothetical protein